MLALFFLPVISLCLENQKYFIKINLFMVIILRKNLFLFFVFTGRKGHGAFQV
jgi:hypothetical protein